MRLRHRLRRSLMGLMVFVALLAVLMALLRDRSQSALYRPWIGLFASDDPSQRREAAVAVGLLRLAGITGQEADEALGLLIAGLDDADRGVRLSATRSLRYFGAEAARGVPGLVRMLKDSHSDLRAMAVPTLCAIGSVDA